MKFNRLFSLILCAMMLFSFAFAENTQADAVENADVSGDTQDAISTSEILSWVENILARPEIAEENPEATQKEDLGYAVKRESCTIYYDSEDIENAHVTAIRVNDPSFNGPRGEMIYDEQSELLKIYPNDNVDLVGDRDFAVLYLETQMPDRASYGIVSRDGQKIRTVEYYVHELKPSGMYSNIVLSFEIENNSIESISAYGFMDEISEEAVYENIQNISAKKNANSYFAYKTSPNGDELEPFEREDLIFSGIDVLSVDSNKLAEILGHPDTDERNEIDGVKQHVLSWNGITASFVEEENTERISRFTIDDSIIEGPRGTVIGDKFSTVYSRFMSSGNAVNDDNQEILYGDDKNFGIASYYPNGMELIYQKLIEISSKKYLKAVAIFNFAGDELSEISIVLQKE